MEFFKKDKKVELQIQLDELQEKNSVLIQECHGYKKTIASFVDVKSSYDEKEHKLIKQYEKQIAELNLSLEKEKKSVARKFNQALAKIGVTKFAPEEIVQSEQTPSSSKAIYDKFISMPEGVEKQKYASKHDKEISEFTGLRQII